MSKKEKVLKDELSQLSHAELKRITKRYNDYVKIPKYSKLTHQELLAQLNKYISLKDGYIHINTFEKYKMDYTPTPRKPKETAPAPAPVPETAPAPAPVPETAPKNHTIEFDENTFILSKPNLDIIEPIIKTYEKNLENFNKNVSTQIYDKLTKDEKEMHRTLSKQEKEIENFLNSNKIIEDKPIQKKTNIYEYKKEKPIKIEEHKKRIIPLEKLQKTIELYALRRKTYPQSDFVYSLSYYLDEYYDNYIKGKKQIKKFDFHIDMTFSGIETYGFFEPDGDENGIRWSKSARKELNKLFPKYFYLRDL